jgi:hypothetical protein
VIEQRCLANNEAIQHTAELNDLIEQLILNEVIEQCIGTKNGAIEKMWYCVKCSDLTERIRWGE